MPGTIEKRLAELGVEIGTPAAPAANYVPTVRTGNLVFISGQVSQDASGLIKGKLGADMSVEDGAKAARSCAIRLIEQMKMATGDLDKVKRVVKLLGMVNSTPDFPDHPKVVNGCSDLLVEVFGDKGRHARSAVGVVNLPFGVAVEVEAIIEVE